MVQAWIFLDDVEVIDNDEKAIDSSSQPHHTGPGRGFGDCPLPMSDRSRLARLGTAYICPTCRLQQRRSIHRRAQQSVQGEQWPNQYDERRGTTHVTSRAVALPTRPSDALSERRNGSRSRLSSTSSRPFRTVTPSRNASAEEQRSPAKGIMAHLREWQELYGNTWSPGDSIRTEGRILIGGLPNAMNRVPLGFAQGAYAALEDFESQHPSVSAFEDGLAVGDDTDPHEFRMGDLVEVDLVGILTTTIPCVFVRQTEKYCQVFAANGKWMNVTKSLLQYRVSGWMSPATVAPLLDHMPKLDELEGGMQQLRESAYMNDMSIPRTVSAPYVVKLTQWSNAVADTYRRHAVTLDQAHATLADEHNILSRRLVDIAAALYETRVQDLSDVKLCAVYRALRFAPDAFFFDRTSHRATGMVQIQSKKQMKASETVSRWVREWQSDSVGRVHATTKPSSRHDARRSAECIRSFISKARKIVLESRRDRPLLTDALGISRHRLPITPETDAIRISEGVKFDDNDVEILKWISTWAFAGHVNHGPVFASLVPLVLQRTGLYDEAGIEARVGQVFLAELGVILPFDDQVRYDQFLLLPVHPQSVSLRCLIEQVEQLRDQPNFVDSMQGLRHEWKDVTAYSVDGPDAEEIDDAVSVERGDRGSDGKATYWIHVHVANPTAFFSNDHPISLMAQQMCQTVYLPEEVHPMMPAWISQNHFSLGNDRPCLSFSMQIDDEGNLLDQVIRPGTLRKHVQLTYQDLDRILGTEENALHEIQLTVGGKPPAPPRSTDQGFVPDAAQREDFELWAQIAKRLQTKRELAGAFPTTHQNSVPAVWSQYKRKGVDLGMPHWTGARKIEGDPVISMTFRRHKNPFVWPAIHANTLVMEAMLLAGQAASRWCAERRLPSLFRRLRVTGSTPLAEPGEEHVENPMHVGDTLLENIGRASLSTTPGSHDVLGLDGYVRVTSPLRRFSDMIVHWQIESTLREEARRSSSLTDTSPASEADCLPFSSADLNDTISALDSRERSIKSGQKRALNYWLCQLIHRAHICGERTDSHLDVSDRDRALAEGRALARFPTTFHVYMSSVPSIVDSAEPIAHAHIVELGIAAHMDWPQSHGLQPAQTADVWEAQLSEVDMVKMKIVLKPVRLIRRLGQDGWRGWVGYGEDAT